MRSEAPPGGRSVPLPALDGPATLGLGALEELVAAAHGLSTLAAG